MLARACEIVSHNRLVYAFDEELIRAPMIERLSRIASHLHGFRLLLLLVALCALGVLLWRAPQVDVIEQDGTAIASLLVFCWSLLLYAVAALFRHIPHKTALTDGLLSWLGSRVQRGVFWLLGVTLCVLGLAVAVLSYQLLRVMTL